MGAIRPEFESFHFLFEPHLLLRFKGRKSELIRRVLPRVVRAFERAQDLAPNFDGKKSVNLDYSGEANAWSPTGWRIAVAYLHCTSCAVLEILAHEKGLLGYRGAESMAEWTRDQYARYLSHLLFNEFGNGWLEEAFLHCVEASGRIRLLLSKAQEPEKSQLEEINQRFLELLRLLGGRAAQAQQMKRGVFET